MSTVKNAKAYVFHTDVGTIVTEISTVGNYGVEDIIRDRAVSQARTIQFLNQAKRSSPNDAKGARTLNSVYTQIDVELPT